MMEDKYLSLVDLPEWLAKLASLHALYVPKKEGAAVVYRSYTEGDVLELATKATESAKHIVFPRSEVLFNFYKKRINDQEGRVTTLEEPKEPLSAIIFGVLPCDARGFFSFDPVYDGSGTGGKAKDVYYLKRREKTLLIAHACKTSLSTCFCNWVGSAPADASGADILMTDVEDGVVFKPVTDKGKDLLTDLKNAEQWQIEQAAKSHAAALAAMPKAPDLSTAKEALLAKFDDMDFWVAESAPCISCGTCTYLCPTCYCFNITDESNGLSGTRLRSWDNCMASMFTLESSGHNPRTGKAMRLRNRIGHKFSYYPSIHEERFSCAGCGRCIKSCPSSIDIRRIVLNAITGKEKEASNG